MCSLFLSLVVFYFWLCLIVIHFVLVAWLYCSTHQVFYWCDFQRIHNNLQLDGTKIWLNGWYWMEWVPSHSIPLYSCFTKPNNGTWFYHTQFHSIPPPSINPNIVLVCTTSWILQIWYVTVIDLQQVNMDFEMDSKTVVDIWRE